MAHKVMLKIGDGNEPVPKPSATASGMPKLPLYIPKDVVKPTTIKLVDKREINPASGKPFKTKGTKGIDVDIDNMKAIIAHAKSKGVDPSTALAIALQETEMGRLGPSFGETLGYEPDSDIYQKFNTNNLDDPELNRNLNASRLANALKDKLMYAQSLRKKGVIPVGEEYDIQAYNGLGVLQPRLNSETSFYEIPVSAKQPLDLKKNPAYGKIVKQLRDDVIRTNSEISKLIDSTPAYGAQKMPSKVMLKVNK